MSVGRKGDAYGHQPVLLARLHWSHPTHSLISEIELWPGYGVVVPPWLTTNGSAEELVRCLPGPRSARVHWEAVHPGIVQTLTDPLALVENLWRVSESIAPQWHSEEAFERWVARRIDELRPRWLGLWEKTMPEA